MTSLIQLPVLLTNQMKSFGIPCAFHQNKHLTNFCQCEPCMLPLCPTCIKIHTEEHIYNKTNPQYENIYDIISQVQDNVQSNIQTFNQNYQSIVEFESKVEQMKLMIYNNIEQFKNDIVKEVTAFFTGMKELANNQISSMNYAKSLKEYKQNVKSHLQDLKIIKESLLDDCKVVRTIIKYKSKKIPELFNTFNKQIENFIMQLDKNSAIFSVREDYKQSLKNYLQDISKFSLQDIQQIIYPININSQLKEIAKQNEIKIDTLKSVENIRNLSSHNLSSNISCSGQITSINGRRKSLSKGKGLTILHQFSDLSNTMSKSSLANTNKFRRILDINHDKIQFPGMYQTKTTTTAYRKIR